MNEVSFGKEYLAELESEVRASRRCLEAIPESLYDWKPHDKSMNMGYLSLLVADIPRWITYSIEKSVIDFSTYDHFQLSTTADLVNLFDRNIEGARRALGKVSNEELAEAFFLKNAGTTLFTTSKKESIRSTINHWVHHRGQLTVYMRLNDLPVPSIYGPSADDRTFG
jgi:uncharacterized damage-inducible protein DinB